MPKPIRVIELQKVERLELLKSVRLGRVRPIRFEAPVIHRRGPRHDDYSTSALEDRAVSKDEVVGTLPERIVYKELEYRHIPFDFQSSFFGGRLELGGMVADFVLLDRPLIIRVQGEYWHMPLQTQRRDAAQKGVLEGYGYQVEDLWDYEIYSADVFYDRMDRILSFMPQIGGGIVSELPMTVGNLKNMEEITERLDRLENALFRGQMSQQIVISARNIQVASLSAISANMGSILAGSITGAEITVAGGVLTAPYLKFTQVGTADYTSTFQTVNGTDDALFSISHYDVSGAEWVAQLTFVSGATPTAILATQDASVEVQTDSVRLVAGATGVLIQGLVDANSTIDAASGFVVNGAAGVTGSFVDNNANTVTVVGGIITNLGV